MTRIHTPVARKTARAPKSTPDAAQATDAPLPANLVLITPVRYRGTHYPATAVINPAELGMDAETVRWLVATGTVEDPDGDEK